jgi:hypothetical protein
MTNRTVLNLVLSFAAAALASAFLAVAPELLAQATQPAERAPPDLSKLGLTPLSDAVGADGRHYVTYRTAADAAQPAVSVPPGWELWAPLGHVAGNRYAVTLRELVGAAALTTGPPATPAATAAAVAPATAAATRPAMTPAPSTAPAPPPLTVLTATAPNQGTPPQSYSVNHVAGQMLANLSVSGYRFGAVCQSYQGGLTIRNCRFLDSMSDLQMEGSGVYASAIPGPISVTDSLLGWNGRPRSAPATTPTEFRQGWYGQGDAAAPIFTNTIFIGNANVGCQLRNGGTLLNCLLIDNGTGVEAVMGRVTIRDCLILSAHLWFDGANYTGGSGLIAYNPVEIDNTTIVGTVGQCSAAPNANHPGARLYPQAAVVSGGTWNNHDHPPFVAPPAGARLITGTGNRIAGWSGPAFGGLKPHDGSGFVVSTKPIVYDWSQPVADYLSNQRTAADTIARVKADVAALLR